MHGTHFDWKGSKAMKYATIFVFVSAILALAPQPAQAQINVSGYEVFLGVPCTINNESVTCGVQFAGWTGGGGPMADGWTRFPGNEQGLWTANINYSGKAGFGSTVTLVGGSWELLLKKSPVLKGTVSSGSVVWPAQGTDAGCGTNVATLTAALAVKGGGAASFAGCLHDLPALSVIPPQIWGTFMGLP
jgi:hypothetical protein